MRTRGKRKYEKGYKFENLLFCVMLVLTLSINIVSVQADALDYLGNTIDGSILTNGMESEGIYQSVARKYIFTSRNCKGLQINGNGYVGIAGATQCNVSCNTVN